MCVYMYMYMCIYVRVYVYICTCICVYMYAYMCIYVHVYVYICTCMCVICTCICVYFLRGQRKFIDTHLKPLIQKLESLQYNAALAITGAELGMVLQPIGFMKNLVGNR